MPSAKPEPELPPLPEVGRGETAPLISASWLAAGVVVVVLLVVGLVLFWNRGGGEANTVTNPPAVEEPDGQGAEQPQPPADEEPPAPVVEPGLVPDLEDQHVVVAVNALAEAGLRYVVVEVESDDAAAGIVFQQSPSPGTETDANTVVTLVAGR
jgi:beta-lactam-binding protein with PASTA domain